MPEPGLCSTATKRPGIVKSFSRRTRRSLTPTGAAKATMNEILCGSKLPKIDKLKESRKELIQKKKSLSADYRKAQKEMRELVTVKGNVDHLLNVTDTARNKEQER